MATEAPTSRILLKIRVVSLLGMFLIAFVGTPKAITADTECEDYLITCSTETACQSAQGHSCGIGGGEGCEGEGITQCSEEPEWGCEEPEFPMATICDFDPPK